MPFRGDVPTRKLLESASTLHLPIVAYGELYYGVLKAKKRALHLAELEAFLEIVLLAYPTERTAQIYGEIKLQLKRKGMPIPENDIWIAATAMQHGLFLATKDNHFSHIEDLQLVDL